MQSTKSEGRLINLLRPGAICLFARVSTRPPLTGMILVRPSQIYFPSANLAGCSQIFSPCFRGRTSRTKWGLLLCTVKLIKFYANSFCFACRLLYSGKPRHLQMSTQFYHIGTTLVKLINLVPSKMLFMVLLWWLCRIKVCSISWSSTIFSFLDWSLSFNT